MAAENFGISIGSKIAELLVEPIVNQFRYICCFGNFVEDLRKQEKNLTLALDRVQNAINAATRNAEEIEKDVLAWIEDANKAMEDVNCLENDIKKDKSSFTKWRPKCIWQYQLSKRMATETSNLVQLQEKGNFQRVSYQATLPCIEFLSKDFIPSRSSQLALNKIMEALKDDSISVIGLYGMGGVGKTTLVKEVGKHVKKLKLFDKVLMLVVSQVQDLIQIQDQMADKLYLYLREKSKEGRASRLWQRLKNEKKILIILDDVWKSLDLKDIGIPFGDDHEGCKILLTTRLQHVCTSMHCEREIPLHALAEDEACALFKKNANVCDEFSTLTNMATEVVRECKGLPIAIVTVARALRGKNIGTWEVALRKLKASRLTDIRDVNKDDNAYTCLKLSFDYLQCEETRLCFFMCSLFPEDHEIFIEDLVRYAVGLGIYEDVQTVEEARSEVFESIFVLKASCLLLETESNDSVKMHDVVRDFALWISSKVENNFKLRPGIGLGRQTNDFSKYTTLSLMDGNIIELADGLVCPKLEMLLLDVKRTQFSTGEDSSDSEEDTNDAEKGYTDVPSTCFNGIKELKVLYLAHGFISLHSLKFLTNLQTLELRFCKIKCFTSLQKLKKLKILNLHGSSITELPEEIAELGNLRLLDLTRCEQLERIPLNTIQRLSNLEELYIGVRSFGQWEVDETSNQRRNASLLELNSLPHLAVLWLFVRDDQIPNDFVFPNLSRYRMLINYGIIDNIYPSRPGNPTSRSIYFSPGNINTLNACKKLFLNAYDLNLEEIGTPIRNIIPIMDRSGFNHLKCLSFFLCRMDCLINTKQHQVPPAAFSNLQKIHIGKTSLREICDGEPPEKFLEKLKTLEMFVSYGIITVFPAKLWRVLQNLETVVLHGCDSVEEVFQLEGLEGAKKDSLSRLTSLRLEYVPRLRHVWKGPTHHINLRSLTYLKLDGCNELTSIFSPCLAHSLVKLETLDISHCKQLKHVIAEKDEHWQGCFTGALVQLHGLQNLKILKIYGCNELEYIFPMSIAQGLLHLEEINIGSAAELKQFFSQGERVVPSAQLVELKHESCSNLSYFSTGNFAVSLPYLQQVEFSGCPKLSMGSIIKVPVHPKGSTSSGQERVQNPEGVQLKRLILTGCEELELIVAEDDDNRNDLSFRGHIQAVSFTNLLHIRVYRCNKLKRIFPITIAQGLPHLKYLEVLEAYQLEEAFQSNEEAYINNERQIVLPKLERLILKELPNLIRFCHVNYHFLLPSLEVLTVQGCPQITTRFFVAPDGRVHAKTRKPQVVEQDMATGSATTKTDTASGSTKEGIE